MKKHWWLGHVVANGCSLAVEFGSDRNFINARAINDIRVAASKKHGTSFDGTVLVSVSYLGHMTNEEYNG